ncbi:MAG: YfiR family protein [Burkholderiales bacterium]|nr:YfiR family protein [Burkholderiales bacterium]
MLGKLAPSLILLLQKLRTGVLAVLLAVSFPTHAIDGIDDGAAVPVKAAYLFRFSQYVDWPTGSFSAETAPLTIAVLDDERLAAELARITQGRVLNTHPIVVRAVKGGDNLSAVQMLFVGAQDMQHLKPVLDGLGSQAVLTITDSPAGLDAGSVINFLPVGQHIRFEISLDAAERSGLKLSSRLLAVAQHVRGKVP